MEIEGILQRAISQSFQDLFGYSLPEYEIILQSTRKEFPGSHTFVTFPYARFTKKSPEDTARAIGEYLVSKTNIVHNFNTVKGFLNLELSDKVWLDLFAQILKQSLDSTSTVKGEKVMVEFSSPNTNKPLHLGHLRNNFLGDSVSRILEASGYTVQRVNIVNDRGIHICKSMIAYELFGKGETPASAHIKGDHLVGNYYVKFDQAYKKQVKERVQQGVDEETAKKEAPLMVKAQDMLKKWEQGDKVVIDLWKKMNNWVYEGFDETYQKIGISFNKIYYESNTYLLGKDIVEEGLEKKVFFKEADGSVWADLTNEGLDKKLVLRADGTSVYMTQDLGTADMRYNDFNFNKCIYVVGNEQDYHFNVLFKILKRLDRPYADGLYHLSYGMVDLPSGKMKSREGTVVDADDLIDEMILTAKSQTEALGKIEGFTAEQARELYQILGMGALKYFLLKVEPKKRMLFNPEESVQFQGNTAPFIQYTHARIAAILRKAEELGINYQSEKEFDSVISLQPAEQTIIGILSAFPQKLELAAKTYSPAVLAQYVYDLAKEYNKFYAEVPIFNAPDPQTLSFRIAFSAVMAHMIRKNMELLGILVPDRM